MKKLVLVEKNHLIRLGLHRLLSDLSNEWETISLDINNIHELPDTNRHADLVILGLPADPSEGHTAVALIEEILHPTNMLLLSEQSASWSPLECDAGSIYACVDKKASTDTLAAAVRFGLNCKKKRFNPAGVALDDTPLSATESPSACDFVYYDQSGAHNVQQLDDMAIAEVSDQAKPAPEPAVTAPGQNSGETSGHGANLLNVTPRQYEVLKLLARGYPIKTVARMMDIATATAKAHTASLYRQLKVKSRGEAVYTARQKGALLN